MGHLRQGGQCGQCVTPLQQVDSGMDMTSESTPFTSRWEDAGTGALNVEQEQEQEQESDKMRKRSRLRSKSRESELLKAEDVRTHACAIFFENLRKICTF